jgi:RHS repeat-associated protein
VSQRAVHAGRRRSRGRWVGRYSPALAVLALTLTLVAGASSAPTDSGPGAGVLGREPQLTPDELGNGSLDGLQYADPAESIALIEPPEASNQGNATLEHPLPIPAGRGIRPELSLAYDSGGGNGWVGTGWDLSVGEISVETRWGVPRYDAAKESETYLLDGDVLSPTAVRSVWQDRVAERQDFTRRTETDYDLIIRHGDSPKNYWWEVRDKSGGVRWYGGFPDGGGPDVGVPATTYQSLQRDPSAILSDEEGNAYRWALSAERDVGINMIRYFYETVDGQRVGSEQKTVGKELYLKRIRYTAAPEASGHPEDPAYEIRFLRDGDLSPRPPARKDVVVDARGGFLEVTSDLLRRIEVWYGEPKPDESMRDFTVLSRRYDLNYVEGAFGKSLLKSVDQVGSDGAVYATNVFGYFDDVRDQNGNYDGFAATPDWNTGDDSLEQILLGPVEISALGASETNSGDVHGYFGFNPGSSPSKSGSFGGAITIKGGATEGLAEMMDINGDLLPDKVFRKERGGPVFYRLNTSGPDGSHTFEGGSPRSVVNLDNLSTEFNIGVGGGPEAYFGVSVQFNIAGDVTVGEDYFTDVNTDGLPDFVSAGEVYFNHLDANGDPSFTQNSSLTSVPIDDGTASIPALEALEEVEQQQRARSPLQDTVRRWVAPFAGTISIDAPVTLDPPPDSSPYGGDGVRVAIQRGGAELWTATLTAPGQIATPTGVGAVSVNRGQAVYFRVGSIDDGVRDQVLWDPRVTYTSYAETTSSPALDVNDLSQSVFDASDDFTLAGRPDTKVLMPLAGTVRFDATLRKTEVTTDDLTVQVLRNGVPVIERPISAATVDAAGIDVSGDFTVAAPSDTDGDGVVESADEIVVRIAVDSPIDVTALDWAPRLYYLSATSGGEPVQVSDDPDDPYVVDEPDDNPIIELVVPADIDIYPQNTLTAPRTGWTSDLGRSVTVHAAVGTLGNTPAGDVVLTVKQRGELVAKRRFTVPAGALGSAGSGEVAVTLANGEDYWFDLSIRDPGLSDRVVSSSVELRWTDGTAMTRVVPHVRNWAGPQSVFPVSYRGWGYAGYNGDGDRATEPIDQQAFVFQQSDFPQQEPTGFDDTSYQDPMQGDAYAFTPFQLDLLDASGQVVGTAPVWRGFKDNIVGAAGFARSSRTGSDNPAIASPSGAGVRGVRQVGVSAPAFALVAGIGPLSGSFGVGPSFGLLDYADLNGDGFPDIVAPGYVQYTGPRGGYLDQGDGVTIVGQDFTFAVGGGFSGSAVEIKGNSKGDANTAQSTALVSGSARNSTSGGSARQGESASGDQYGASIGGSLGITASFTNPNAPDPAWQDALDDIPAGPGALEEELADVNGDGLPDKVAVDANGVRVRFNLGDGFASDPIRWASGGFETGEAYSGSVGPLLGFQINNKEFSGGLAYNESVDFARYSWADVDGDGILDRLRKDSSGIRVAFGTNSGVLSEVDYGDLNEGVVDLIGDIPTGQQVAQGRSRGLGGGFDFTIGIGPLCLPTPNCYIIINPGVHFDHSVSTNQIQLADVNGDGYPDSLRSDADNQLSVRLNNRGRTNLLRSVTSPLGGEIRLDYTRDGNSVEQPYSQWLLSTVEVDDNRAGDGPDTLLTTYEYSGNVFNPLEREFLGYETVVERQRAFAGDSNPMNDPLLRSVEREYRNATVFDSGLQTRETLRAPNGTPLKETRMTWRLVDLATEQPADLAPTPSDPAGVRLLEMAVGPVQTRVEQRWYDDAGNLGQETWNTFEYDDLGNVVRQVDVGEPELPADDLIAEIIYSNCEISSDPDNYHTSPPECPAASPPGPDSPLWDPLRCPTWTSLPAEIRLLDGQGNVLRRRNGAPSLCDNSSVTDLREFLSDTEFAQTLLAYDDWGSYNHIEYPENADGDRLVVDYVYDDVNHGNIAEVTDSHGLTSTATFDGPTGLIASRTDANGQTTSYTYDAFGRLASITGPYEQGTGNATVTFEYFPTAPGYAHAVAHHFDAFHPGDTIDTVAFLDGIARETQTKQDGTVFRGAGAPPEDVMIVAGAVEFDALGRPVKEWYPIEEPLGTIGVYNTGTAATDPTQTTWNLIDLETRVENPDGSSTQTAYGFGGQADVGATVFTTTVTDAEGKPQRSYSNVRDNVLVVDDLPATAPRLRTRFEYDPLGQLTRVVDNGGNATTHTYDLIGRRTSTRTPDGGLVELRWDGASNLIAKVTPNLRAAGQQIDYEYDIERLVAVDNPAGTEDVDYTYGEAGAPGNGAGRIVSVVDGAREQSLTYDPLGALAEETTTMLVHNLNDETEERLTFVTSFTYDGLGRTRTLTYPDGELLSHDYDSGGLLASISGEKAGHVYDYLDRLEYDEFLDRRFQETGNDVQSLYGYDAETRRLARQVTNTPAREIQDLNYTYDLVGNVLELDNQLPPPVPELKGGPSMQTYHYDPYYRLASAEGTYFFAPNKRRDYTFTNAYDVNGNIVRKTQRDVIDTRLVQRPTTYDLTIEYNAAGPHQITRIGTRSYTYDLNGNFTGWTEDRTGQNRSVTWDAADRMRSVADQGATTRYTYDDSGRLAIERGPSGETSFVNQWYTVRNGTVAWKHIWAGDDRLATKRVFTEGEYEHMRYFLHKDLQGSTNIVTDNGALVFQHLESFPGGETWVHEHSDIHRTPYLYAGGYLDEVRQLVNFGERWYEPREQFLYSADPVLAEDPLQVIGDPALLPAYSYAESNPLRLIDRSGRAPSSVRAAFSMASALLSGRQDPATARFAVRAAQSVVAAARATGMTQADLAARVAAVQSGNTGSTWRSSRLWQALERFASSPRAKKLAAFTDRFEAKPLVQINLVGTAKGWALQDIKVSPTFFLKQFTVFKGAAGKTPASPASAAPDAGAAAQGTGAGGAVGAPAALAAPQAASRQSAPPPDSGAP